MSNEHHHTSSLMAELVEMATATKRLPDLERELREAYQRIDQLVARTQELEGKIMSEVAINTDLAAKLHAAEVARDDAGFRQLEAEDRAVTLLRHIEGMFSGMGSTLAAVKGDGKDNVYRMDTAERVDFAEFKDAKEAAAAKQMEDDRRAAEEAAKPVDPMPPVNLAGTVEGPQVANVMGTSSEGERAADPTGGSWAGTPLPSAEPSAPSSITSYGGVSVPSDPTVSQPISPSGIAHGTSVSSQDGAAIASGKYTGKRYADWPYYVSEDSWCANGGTHESYWEGRGQFKATQQGL